MALVSLGASHRDLDLGALERLSAGAGSLAPAVLAGPAAAAGAVVLATCNRLEVYLDVSPGTAGPGDEAAVRATAAAVSDSSGVPVAEVAAALQVRRDAAVAAHLFAVAAGLESMVIGEREIGGQVRRALTAGRTAGTTTAPLERLFQSASRAARAAHTGTGLGGDGRSVVSVALDLAAPALAGSGPVARPWAQVRAVLIGTGSYAGASLAALRARGCTDVRVFSPSGRADVFAATHGLAMLSDADLAAGVAEADLVVACSGSGGVRLGSHRRRARPVVVVDLALQRDVDRRTTDDAMVHLIDLHDVRSAAPPQQGRALAAAREVVAAAVAEFEATGLARSGDQAVVTLRRHAQRLLDAEVDRVRRRAPDAAGEVEQALHRFSRALLHAPTVRARDHATRGDGQVYADALRTLFGIAADRPRPGAAEPTVAPVHTGPMTPVLGSATARSVR